MKNIDEEAKNFKYAPVFLKLKFEKWKKTGGIKKKIIINTNQSVAQGRRIETKGITQYGYKEPYSHSPPENVLRMLKQKALN